MARIVGGLSSLFSSTKLRDKLEVEEAEKQGVKQLVAWYAEAAVGLCNGVCIYRGACRA